MKISSDGYTHAEWVFLAEGKSQGGIQGSDLLLQNTALAVMHDGVISERRDLTKK